MSLMIMIYFFDKEDAYIYESLFKYFIKLVCSISCFKCLNLSIFLLRLTNLSSVLYALLHFKEWKILTFMYNFTMFLILNLHLIFSSSMLEQQYELACSL